LSKKRLSLQSQTWIEDLCRFPIGLGPDGALWIVSLNLVPDFYNKWKGGWSVSTIEIKSVIKKIVWGYQKYM
jgi:hypothetical protein